jgi:hypothetical protein
MPLDLNSPVCRHIMKTKPQSQWTVAVSPFPHCFCRIHEEEVECATKIGPDGVKVTHERVKFASFYLPGETVTMGGVEYTVQHNKTLVRTHPKPLSKQAKRRLRIGYIMSDGSLLKTERSPQ